MFTRGDGELLEAFRLSGDQDAFAGLAEQESALNRIEHRAGELVPFVAVMPGVGTEVRPARFPGAAAAAGRQHRRCQENYYLRLAACLVLHACIPSQPISPQISHPFRLLRRMNRSASGQFVAFSFTGSHWSFLPAR